MKSAAVIIENDNGEILLMKRSINASHDVGKWENCGGKVEENEEFEDAIIREVYEELGIRIIDLEFIYENKSESDSNGKTFHVKVFKAKHIGIPIVMEPEICDEIGWFSKDKLKDIDLAQH